MDIGFAILDLRIQRTIVPDVEVLVAILVIDRDHRPIDGAEIAVVNRPHRPSLAGKTVGVDIVDQGRHQHLRLVRSKTIRIFVLNIQRFRQIEPGFLVVKPECRIVERIAVEEVEFHIGPGIEKPLLPNLKHHLLELRKRKPVIVHRHTGLGIQRRGIVLVVDQDHVLPQRNRGIGDVAVPILAVDVGDRKFAPDRGRRQCLPELPEKQPVVLRHPGWDPVSAGRIDAPRPMIGAEYIAIDDVGSGVSHQALQGFRGIIAPDCAANAGIDGKFGDILAAARPLPGHAVAVKLIEFGVALIAVPDGVE
ncbi:hypothetical protein SDC9_92290 [bioreactor metagenome]|uniref:Uncharacterized protein n=1 Tax=bioreactor metagenome TaxID=1076179 RepID=A0A644ZXQ4_9ZZZZ